MLSTDSLPHIGRIGGMGYALPAALGAKSPRPTDPASRCAATERAAHRGSVPHPGDHGGARQRCAILASAVAAGKRGAGRRVTPGGAKRVRTLGGHVAWVNARPTGRWVANTNRGRTERALQIFWISWPAAHNR